MALKDVKEELNNSIGGRTNVVEAPQIIGYNPTTTIYYNTSGDVSEIRETFGTQTFRQTFEYSGDDVVVINPQEEYIV